MALTADFELLNPQEVFSIPYLVASETYVWSSIEFHFVYE